MEYTKKIFIKISNKKNEKNIITLMKVNYMDIKKKYRIITIIISLILLYSLFWFVKTILIEKIDFSYNISYLLSFIPVFIGITGSILFFSSNFKKSGLLRMFMCFEIIVSPISLWYYLSVLLNADTKYKALLTWPFYLSIVISIALISCCAIGLYLLAKNTSAKFEYTIIGGESIAEFSPASTGVRFINWLIDSAIILYILYIVIQKITMSHTYGSSYFFESAFRIYILELLIIILYYLILEGIFKTSIGKCATATIVTNTEGGDPGFAKILGRTLCRFIPFDALSFFGSSKRGWHDSIPKTYVVRSINKEDDDLL